MKKYIWKQIENSWKSIYEWKISCSKINVTVDEPEFGLFDITLSTSDGRKFVFSISEVYSPLENIRDMLKGWIFRDGVLSIEMDCEHYNVIIGIMPTNIYKNKSAIEYGVLNCFINNCFQDDYKNEIEEDSLVAIVEIEQVALAIYSAFRSTILSSQALLDDPEAWREEDLIEEYYDKKITTEEYRQELFNRYLKIPGFERLLTSSKQ
ncbi:MAG: hypothetical protein K2H39_02440 [Paramuribaculum sp.]|nr:hypothetical protein [Paramuribaculum sp.]